MALAGSKGSSQSKTDSTSTTTNTQTTVNNVDNSIHTSDENALLALTDVSREAFDLGREALGTTERATYASLDNALQSYGRSLDFAADIGGDALSAVEGSNERIERFATEALTQNTDLVTGVFNFARDLFGDVTSATESLSDTHVAGLTALATQTSATSEDRISKIVIWAIAAAAAIFIVPKVFK